MTQSAYITRIGTAVPQFKVLQEQAARFMSRTVASEPELKRKVEVLYRATRIQERYSVLGDYASQNGFSFFPENVDLEPFPTTAQRMEAYRVAAAPLGVKAVQDGLSQEEIAGVTHLITVSCTGMYAPGLDIDLLNHLGLPGTVQRTCINFMGCYAAFNALKVADALVRAHPDAKVLIVSVELCSLHFQKETSRDQLLANSLFSDGAAAVLVEGKPKPGINLSLAAFRCELIPDGAEDMAWNIRNTGFEMRLSAYVPKLLGGAAEAAIQQLKKGYGIEGKEIQHYAIHPGGRKILETLEQALKIEPEKNKTAYETLKYFGNMSSATVLFVLKSLMNSLSSKHHEEKVLSMAFGPGLTLESAIFEIFFNS